MAPIVTLFAWAVPAFVSGSPVDHTWVTTYDNRQTVYPDDVAVAQAGQDYWYCWGGFHPTGGTPPNPTGFLGDQSGDLALARCSVRSNADSRQVPAARGTIFQYGVDGVCHQLANQVLWATAATGPAVLTVRNARGYMISSYIYGTYGLQVAAWAARIATCGGAPAPPAGMTMGGMAMAGPPDDFEARAREVLTGKPDALANLLALRVDTQRFAAQAWPGATPSVETLNARNQHLLDQAALVLRKEEFEAIFGVAPGTKVDLIDPTIMPPDQRR